MKYHFRIHIKNSDDFSAGTKAVQDCTRILEEEGFINLQINFPNNKESSFSNLFILFSGLLKMFFKTEKKSTVIIQYPVLGINRFISMIVKILKRKKCVCIALIHDLDSLRNIGITSDKIEFKNLNAFDFLITHNEAMTAWLRKNKVSTKCFELNLFDYLIGDNANNVRKKTQINDTIIFAGSLSKSTFVYQLPEISNVNFNIYGPGFNSSLINVNNNVNWKGSFPPEELPFILDGKFGLIWDGEFVNSCEGIYGNYLQYNSPHKISLYIIAGLPVIIPADAALAPFVIENNIGLTVHSLHQINAITHNLSSIDYAEMQKNVCSLRLELIKGNFLKNCLHNIYQQADLELNA